jgi:hypothetical protein
MESENRISTQEFPGILWTAKIYCPANNSSPLAPILNQINQFIPPHPPSLRCIILLYSYLRLSLPSGLFPFGSL